MTSLDKPAFVVVDVPGQIDVAKAADLVGVDLETLYSFNPSLNQWATHPAGPHRILLPATKREEAGRLTGLAPDERLDTTPTLLARAIRSARSPRASKPTPTPYAAPTGSTAARCVSARPSTCRHRACPSKPIRHPATSVFPDRSTWSSAAIRCGPLVGGWALE